MKAVLLLLLSLTGPLAAQVAVPTTPRKFETRTLNGGGSTAGVTITPAPQPAATKVRLVSYFNLSDSRQWKSSDGRSLVGSAIAFEDAVVEIEAADAAAARAAAQKAPAPTPPAKFTLVRDGKVRLLISNKPFEVMLDRLSDEDRQFINELQQRLPQ